MRVVHACGPCVWSMRVVHACGLVLRVISGLCYCILPIGHSQLYSIHSEAGIAEIGCLSAPCTNNTLLVQCRVFSPQVCIFLLWCAVDIHCAACSLTAGCPCAKLKWALIRIGSRN
jgi:hypothetical protein